MFRILPLLLICASPIRAQADVFQTLSGSYGDPAHMSETCEGSPQEIVFADNNTRGAVQVFTDQAGPALFLAIELQFSVGQITPRGVQIAFDEEDRRTDAGDLVVWEFRALKSPDGYCWGRTDWPAERCINTVHRCDDAVPMS